MAPNAEESFPLNAEYRTRESLDTDSTTSIVLEHLNGASSKYESDSSHYKDQPLNGDLPDPDSFDIEDTKFTRPKPADRKARRIFWIIALLCAIGWTIAAVQFLLSGNLKHPSTRPHDPQATKSWGTKKKITLSQVLSGDWTAYSHDISWIPGANGEDGLMVSRGDSGPGFLVVENIGNSDEKHPDRKILMQNPVFNVAGRAIFPAQTWPSKDFKYVLCLSEKQGNWRHSYTGLYWIFDVATQTAEPLDPHNPFGRIQLASWSPSSNAIAFTRDNNLFVRKFDQQKSVIQVTTDGNADLFYGIPDWVFEEEVFSGNSATWWSEDGKYIAFLRTNETEVPTFGLQYYLKRPSGKEPKTGEEMYPDTVDIKYPKAGAPNPIVNLEFYDMDQNKKFSVKIDEDFPDADRLITEVVWAGTEGKVLVRETNRVSDKLKVILIDAPARKGRTVREQDVKAEDGGWFEVSQDTRYVPADPKNGRKESGYVDTVIKDGYDHLGYFTPLDNPVPIMLTSGKWEVTDSPAAMDLQNGWVYFRATKESSLQRHYYRVKFDGSNMQNVTDVSQEGYYGISFSSGGNYGLLSYDGPGVPYQKVVSMPGAPMVIDKEVETNKGIEKLAAEHDLPIKQYSTVDIDGHELNLLERRPPHFDPKKKYPVLFWQYQGPGSQSVSKRFVVDFQSYVAASLGYIVVTLDGRGTGFKGRKTRCAVRGNIGRWESHDQITVAKQFAAKSYVDENRLAIWGWSYGGFMTLKTLEMDAGRTFKYGMAVAPVTDWRFYDSIYTERYMFTPQMNPGGYVNTSIHDMHALSQNVRFLVMHGTSDDNVHTQNTYTLLDKLDLAGVRNYDVHVFPDSDHGIYFHNANSIVYQKLENWLINAFNGEWLKINDPKPKIDWHGSKLVKRDLTAKEFS